MMRRRLGGWGYGVELLGCPLAWFLGCAVSSGADPQRLLEASILIAARYLAEAAALVFRSGPAALRPIWLLPVRDVFAAGVFVAGLVGRTTSWRGHRVRLGRLTRIEDPGGPGLGRRLASPTLAMD